MGGLLNRHVPTHHDLLVYERLAHRLVASMKSPRKHAVDRQAFKREAYCELKRSSPVSVVLSGSVSVDLSTRLTTDRAAKESSVATMQTMAAVNLPHVLDNILRISTLKRRRLPICKEPYLPPPSFVESPQVYESLATNYIEFVTVK